jgi:hypothetical protein
MEGEAIQKDITGARGTPPIKRAAITGITPQEQKGLKAPTAVARMMAVTGPRSKAFFIYLDAPVIFLKYSKYDFPDSQSINPWISDVSVCLQDEDRRGLVYRLSG